MPGLVWMKFLKADIFLLPLLPGLILHFPENICWLPSPKEGLQALGYTLFRDKGVVLSPIVQVEEWKQEAPDDIRFRSMNNTLQNLLPKYDSLSIAVFSGAPQQIPGVSFKIE